MHNNVGGNCSLINKGSVYDLAALYILFIVKHDVPVNDKRNIIGMFVNYLNNGYTYKELRASINNEFYYNMPFPYEKYNKHNNVDGNLITQGTIYYHKELKLMNSLPEVTHNVDAGTMISAKVDYYLEPVASYTLDDLLRYFYSIGMADKQEYNYKRMYGIFKHEIGKYGLDKVLFMIEAAARMYHAENKIFELKDFESYQSIASEYLEEIQNNCKNSGEGRYYVTRKRKLFN